MIKKFILLSAAVLLMWTGVSAKSAKRGVSENEFHWLQQAEALAPGVSWYYNWGNTPPNVLADYSEMVYAPMCWNGNYNAERIREYVKAHPQTKYLLGFNEPNFIKQANLQPSEAAALWPDVQALAKELNLKLVAPALNYTADPKVHKQPVAWMEEFISLVGEDAFDYTAIHAYGGAGVMKDLATQFHNKFGKKVLVTEFCYWPGESGNITPQTQISSMIEAVTWLEKTEWIEAYAWFKSVGPSDQAGKPNYGLIINGTGENPRELSEQGIVYVYMSYFDESVYYPINTAVSAADYVDAGSVLLGRGYYAYQPKPIQITSFNAGAWATWQFDVPESGEYVFRIEASGMGDPTRFNPYLGLYSVNADGKETELVKPKEYALSNDDKVYKPIEFKINLDAGKQAIMLKDADRYSPSGIMLSTVRLLNEQGLEDLQNGVQLIDNDNRTLPTEYYSLDGVRLKEPASHGITIVKNGNCVTKICK